MEEVKWPDLRRLVNWRRSDRGGNAPVLGRKFCSCCGRWRFLVDFGAAGRSDRGVPLRFAARCLTCERVLKRQRGGYKGPRKLGRMSAQERRDRWREQQAKRRRDPAFLASVREYQRIWKEGKRRELGVERRDFRRNGDRDKGKQGRADAIPAGPFVAWLEKWQARQDEFRTASFRDDHERPIAGLGDLAALAGCSVRSFSRARTDGRISLSIVDRVLVKAGDCMWHDLYPESEFPELYVFDEKEVAA